MIQSPRPCLQRLFLHIILHQELALHSKPGNSDIMIMIATIIILTAQRISSLNDHCLLFLQIIL